MSVVASSRSLIEAEANTMSNNARCVLLALFIYSSCLGEDVPGGTKAKPEPVTLRGRVVELGPHANTTFGVPMDDELGKAVIVLVTTAGEVHPLVRDVRSRGFFLDKRLRDREMELHVHKYAGLPFVRVIDAYSFRNGKKHQVDYWCDICAITTYQPGPCPCCQDEIQLRERPVAEIQPGR
jgi:hypothetical protein